MGSPVLGPRSSRKKAGGGAAEGGEDDAELTAAAAAAGGSVGSKRRSAAEPTTPPQGAGGGGGRSHSPTFSRTGVGRTATRDGPQNANYFFEELSDLEKKNFFASTLIK